MAENDIPHSYGIPNPDNLEIKVGELVLQMEEEPINHRFVAKRDGLLALSNNFVHNKSAGTIAGTAGVPNPAGTIIVQIPVAANRVLLLTSIMVHYVPLAAAPVAKGFYVAPGATIAAAAAACLLGAGKEIPVAPAGGFTERRAEAGQALLRVPGGAAGTNVFIYAPAAILGNAANDPATDRYEADWEGVLI